MKYLRRTLGITRRDRIKNADIDIEPITSFIEKRQFGRRELLNMIEEGRQVKRVFQARTPEKRGRGRPGQTWDNVIR